MKSSVARTVNEYLGEVKPEVRQRLESIRGAISQAIPEAQEVISYSMPAFKLGKVFIYYAAFADHLSVFVPPGFGAYDAFADEVTPYLKTKSALHFSYDTKLPLDLIVRLAVFAAHASQDKTTK